MKELVEFILPLRSHPGCSYSKNPNSTWHLSTSPLAETEKNRKQVKGSLTWEKKAKDLKSLLSLLGLSFKITIFVGQEQ